MGRHPREPLPASYRVRQLFAIALLEEGLVIVQIQLRRPSALEEVDHPLYLRSKVGPTERAFFLRIVGKYLTRPQQRSQRRSAQAQAGFGQEISSGILSFVLITVHNRYRLIYASSKFMMVLATMVPAAISS